MQPKFVKLTLVLCLTAALGACSSTKPKDETAPANQLPTADAGAQTGAGDTGAAGGSELAGAEAAMLKENIVHFDYDRSDIRETDRSILDAHGRYLAANPGVSVRLEGHADERGSREYNLALGERRAQSVDRYLKILGVTEGQTNTSSYGEEKPVTGGHDEVSWQQNRRVEIIYPQGK